MKSLEKDRTRRYETANGFARDIKRYLDGDVVEACPPSGSYRLRKFAFKNRTALLTVGSFVAFVILGSTFSIWQAIRATRAEAAAISHAVQATLAEQRLKVERDRAVVAEAQAVAEAEKAERSAAEARAVLGFLQDQVLSAARPEGFRGRPRQGRNHSQGARRRGAENLGSVPRSTEYRSISTIGPGRNVLLPGRAGPRGPATGASPGTSNGQTRPRPPRHTQQPE